MRAWSGRSKERSSEGTRLCAMSKLYSLDTEIKCLSKSQCIVEERARPLETISGPSFATGIICAACASARPPPFTIRTPVNAHVSLYAASTLERNAASRTRRLIKRVIIACGDRTNSASKSGGGSPFHIACRRSGRNSDRKLKAVMAAKSSSSSGRTYRPRRYNPTVEISLIRLNLFSKYRPFSRHGVSCSKGRKCTNTA